MDNQVPSAFSFIEESGGIEAYQLKSNGLRVLLLPQTAAPVVAFMVTYHVGSRNEYAGLTGATHFLEHLMFKGTARFNKRLGTSVFNTLQRVGAELNATTWLDRTNYYELLPKEHLSLAIEIEADRMRGALLDHEELESERTVILNESDRGDNDPMRKLYHAVWSVAYLAHPYHHPTIGWRSDIENIQPDGLRHFYDTFYWPNNATVSIIGDIDRVEVMNMVSNRFGEIKRSPIDIPNVGTREPEQAGERRVEVKMAGQLGAVMLAYKSPSALEKDTDALDTLAMVLTRGKSSRLFRYLTDQGLTTHVMGTTSRLRDPGLFYLYVLLAPEKTHEEVEVAILDALNQIKEEGITAAELQRAKNQLKADEAFGRDGPFAIAAQLNEAIAAGDWKLYTMYRQRVEAVTGEDVRRVAQEYFVQDQCTIGRYLPTPS